MSVTDPITAFPKESRIALTVGIPAFNAGPSLEAALLSILRQSWRGTMEILIVDDGSTDDTVAIADRLARRYGAIRVVRHDRNRGRPVARNTILREARGEYLTWMDSDDEWYPNKLAVQFDHLVASEDHQHGHPVICMCAFDWKWDHSPRASHRVPEVAGDQLKGILSGRIGAYLWTMLARTSAWRAIGEFDENLPRLQDLDFLIRFSASGGRLIVSDPTRPLCIYNKNDDEKPGKVISAALSHIWKKHYPLYRQYGRGFCRGIRRSHLLLASRHGFSNEGRLVGAGYYVLAALASPGWLLRPIRARLRRPRKVVAPKKLVTHRMDARALAPRERSLDHSPAVDLVVSLSAFHDEALRTYFRTWSDRERANGLWYVAPRLSSAGRDRDHAWLIAEAGDEAAAQRVLHAAVLSNGDGFSSVLYLGAPVDLDSSPATAVSAGIAKRTVAVSKLVGMLGSHDVDVRIRLHVIVPDTETLLWRRYLAAVRSGSRHSVGEWLDRAGTTEAQILDHRSVQPLCNVSGVSARVHVLTARSTLNDLVRSIFIDAVGIPPDVLPAAPATPVGLPGRNGGIVALEHILARYEGVLAADQLLRVRQRLWRVAVPDEPKSAPPEVRNRFASKCRLVDYEVRFAPAGVSLSPSEVGGDAENPDELALPEIDRAEFERLSVELRLLSVMADLGAAP